MKNRFYEKEQSQRREVYLLAARNPWLVWRLQALRAGYVPPLLPGEIPPELVGIPLGPRQEEYQIDPLLEQAKRIRNRERRLMRRVFLFIIIGGILLAGMGVFLASRNYTAFKIPLLDVMIPRIEGTSPVQAK